MEWSSQFIVYRIGADGSFTEVFHHDDLKKAKYWLTYIAECGDVLCRTPAHPRHPKETTCAEYMSHKTSSGKVGSNMEEWHTFAKNRGFRGTFPSEQIQAAA